MSSISDIISDIANARAGWITPQLSLVTCEMWEHIYVILSAELPQEIVAQIPAELQGRLLEMRESLEETRRGCEEIDSEWHCYEMACDSARSTVATALYKANWLRFICDKDSTTVEGTPVALKEHGSFLETLRDGLELRGSGLAVQKIKWI
jgi:hypothetical protein